MYARLRCGGNLPLPRPGVDRPLRGNCHPLSCAPDNQVRCVFGSAPYQKTPPGVRGAFSEAFGVKNRLFRYGRDIRYRKRPPTVRGASSKARRTPTPQTVDSPLPHRTYLQCAKRPPLSLFAPAAPSLAPSTALGTRNGPRSEVSRHKKRMYSLEKS